MDLLGLYINTYVKKSHEDFNTRKTPSEYVTMLKVLPAICFSPI